MTKQRVIDIYDDAFETLEYEIQAMREEGENDLRTVLWYLNKCWADARKETESE